MTRLWRVCDARYVEGALSGEGASRYPGRWNQRGVFMVYAATSASLAILEYLVNVDRENAPSHLSLVELRVPGKIETIPERDIPVDWNAMPAPASTQAYGTSWVKSGTSLGLTVPSVVIPTRAEMDVLLNAMHPHMKRVETISTIAFSMDDRLLS